MTSRTLLMPRLGETMDEGVIVGWLVETGAAFRRGDPILELETDKTTVEYPALGDGVLDRPLVQGGDRIAVGAPIAEVTVANAEDWSDGTAPVGEAPVDAGAPAIEPGGVNTLLMPRLGETMEEGVVLRWLIAEGEAYARGDAILEIETDKTVAEVPALSDGRLVRILAPENARLAVGQPIAVVEGEVDGEAPSAAVVAPDVAAADPTPAAPGAARAAGARPRATPVARRLARRAGLSLDALTGTGRRGRIERADVEARLKTPAAAGSGLFAAVPGGRIAYDAIGAATAGTFLLLHGFAGDRTTWAATASALARAGHRVVTPDLPSHGATELDSADIEGLVAALAAFAEGFSGPLRLVGHSMGAAVAALLAARLGARVRELVLVAPAGAGREIDAGFIRGMAAARTPGEIAHLLPLLGPKASALSDGAVAGMAREAARGRLAGLAAALVGAAGQRIDILRPLAALPAALPVRAIFGVEDRIVPATQALNLPPRVAAHFLPAGHMPQWDLPREVAELILKGGDDG